MAIRNIKGLRNLSKLSDSERRISDYVLANAEEVARMSSRELARKTLTSGSGVLRLVRKLGYESYHDFQLDVVASLKNADLAGIPISGGEHAITVMNKIAALEERAVEQTKQLLSSVDIEAIASLLHNANYLDFFARDTPATICRYASHNLMLAGVLANVYDEMDRMVFLSLQLPADHVIVVVSRSGTDKELIAAARTAHNRGITVIAITTDSTSPLARLADHTLLALHYPAFKDFGEVIFSASLKYLFDVIFAMAFSKDSEQVLALNDAYDTLYYTELDRAQ